MRCLINPHYIYIYSNDNEVVDMLVEAFSRFGKGVTVDIEKNCTGQMTGR